MVKKTITEIFNKWPKSYIAFSDLKTILGISDDSLHSFFKRAVKENLLIRIRRDFYLISSKIKDEKPNCFEIAPLIYGPSYISLETALSFHGWIPEAVHIISSVCTKRTKFFETPIGDFLYYNIPIAIFHVGVTFVKEQNFNFFIADPWKALADFIYIKKRAWESILSLSEDMRIELDNLKKESDLNLLKKLAQEYPNRRVRKILQVLDKDLKNL